jgi:hypothetical protein
MSNRIIHQGRGKSQRSLDLIDASFAILQDIQPASVRAVCYRLFVGQFIGSMSKGETSKVSKQLTWAREQGRISWTWIVDETRAPEQIAQWDSPQAVIESACGQYRKNYWAAQPNRVEVWSEKGTIRGTLAPVLDTFGVTFRVMHGYGSATVIHDIAEDIASNDKPLTVVYVGDWDPSGMHMSEVDLPKRLQRYGGAAHIIRVALDDSDVAADTDLQSFDVDAKVGDPRYPWFVGIYGPRFWELDALPPPILRERVKTRIMDLIDHDAWDHLVDIEVVERASMLSFLESWKSSISGPGAKCSAVDS